jgi:stringent starvation protein A
MGVVAKRSSMTFFSGGKDHYSHRVRIVLAEKGVAVEVHDVDMDNPPEDIAEYNPYNTLPVLVDRDLVLYDDSNVMMEYLDERFPHPPLLPVYPVARAESRLWMLRIKKDWCGYVDIILNSRSVEEVEAARKSLRDSLVTISPLFGEKPYFMSDEFTLVDCCVAPILWRLDEMGIELPEKQTKHLRAYMDRLFERESFQASLSEAEQEMNE